MVGKTEADLKRAQEYDHALNGCQLIWECTNGTISQYSVGARINAWLRYFVCKLSQMQLSSRVHLESWPLLHVRIFAHSP